MDGSAYTAPQSFSWSIGSSHSIGVTSPQGSGGTRYVYAYWSDGDGQTHSITVPSSATTYTATFTTQYQLTTGVSPSGSGSVTSSPAGITCGTTCSAHFNSGTSVTLTATPVDGVAFTGWTGSGVSCPGTGTCVVSMTQARSVTATFHETTPPDTSITSGPSGTITVNTATFTWSGSDNFTPTGSLVYAYRLHPLQPSFSAFTSATSRTYTGLANGSYTFYVKAKDQAGNEDPTPASQGATVCHFTDDPLNSRITPIKASHFTELMSCINALRTTKYGLAAYAWSTTAPAPGGTVRAVHLTDLRKALTPAYHAKNGTDPTFAEPVMAGVVIKQSHLGELRTYVRAVE